jgi:hypothetical protein
MRSSCVFFVDMRLHPDPEVVRRAREALAQARAQDGEVPRADAKQVVMRAVSLAMNLRRMSGAFAPRVLETYVRAIIGESDEEVEETVVWWSERY